MWTSILLASSVDATAVVHGLLIFLGSAIGNNLISGFFAAKKEATNELNDQLKADVRTLIDEVRSQNKSIAMLTEQKKNLDGKVASNQEDIKKLQSDILEMHKIILKNS